MSPLTKSSWSFRLFAERQLATSLPHSRAASSSVTWSLTSSMAWPPHRNLLALSIWSSTALLGAHPSFSRATASRHHASACLALRGVSEPYLPKSSDIFLATSQPSTLDSRLAYMSSSSASVLRYTSVLCEASQEHILSASSRHTK